MTRPAASTWSHRRVLPVALVGVGLVGLTAGAALSTGSGGDGTTDGASRTALASAERARPFRSEAGQRRYDAQVADLLLRRVHLAPEALAAAGLSAEEADGVCSLMLLQSADHELVDAVQAATAAYSRALQAAGTPRRAGPGPGQEHEGEQPASASARAENLADSRAMLDGLLDTVWSAATTGLDADKKARLARIRSNQAAGWNLPAPYLVVERTGEDWKRLRSALATKHFVDHGGPVFPHTDTTIVATAHADPDVAAARQGLDLNLEPIQAAWANRLAR